MSADTPYDRLRHFLPDADEVGLDGYRVLHPIGEGGFGRVFKARQLAFDRDVAIKVLSATGFQEETARRFERECRAVGALSDHPNIVTIYDSGITPWGRPYIVMEHMRGGSLAARVVAEGMLRADEALEVMVKICGAVATAHRAGILHRDIKPENLLISAYGEPALADFGVASIPGGYQTQTGAITASLAHAAPEVLDGARATRQTDVYSLGSTLFTLLSGHAPFESPDHAGLQALIARTMTQPVPDLRERGVPEAVCTVIETAMAKDPSDRFADAEDMASNLRLAQDSLGLPVTEMVVAEVAPQALELVEAERDEERATLIRRRDILAPPAPEAPRRRPRWRSPVAAAALALVLAVTVGGTIAVKVRRPQASAARQPAGVAPTPAAASPTSESSERVAVKRKDRGPKDERAARRKTRNGGTIAFAGGSAFSGGGDPAGGAAGAGGGASSSTGSYSDGAGDASSSTGGDGGGSGGGGGGGGTKSGSDNQPPPPAPANLLLYHLYSDDGSYYFTSSTSELNRKTFEYDNSHREAAVWETGTQKMRRICFGDGRCGGWVYIEKPAGIQTRPLYAFTGPHGDYYTTNKAEIPPEYSGYRVWLFGYAQ